MRPSSIDTKTLESIREEIKEPYWGQLKYLADKYNIDYVHLRKIVSRMRNTPRKPQAAHQPIKTKP